MAMFASIIFSTVFSFAHAQEIRSVEYSGTYRSGNFLDSSKARLQLHVLGNEAFLNVVAPDAKCVMTFKAGRFINTIHTNTDVYQFPVAQYCSSSKIFGPTAILYIHKTEEGHFQSVVLKSARLKNTFRYFESR